MAVAVPAAVAAVTGGAVRWTRNRLDSKVNHFRNEITISSDFLRLFCYLIVSGLGICHNVAAIEGSATEDGNSVTIEYMGWPVKRENTPNGSAVQK